jgi:uncharacterized Ntn-hydrolase superfamily protein
MRRHLMLLVPIAIAVSLTLGAQNRPSGFAANGPNDPPSTFSILAFDPITGEIGAAVQSKVFSAGNGPLWAEAGVGAVATQAIIDVSYGPKGLALLKQGFSPKEVIQKLLDQDTDPRPGWPKAGRQVAVIDEKGNVAAHTGPGAQDWKGDKQGKFCTAQGNILAGPDVVARMVENFEKSEFNASGQRQHISLRLVAALEGGQSAGGDTRGQQSAALIVVKKNGGVWLNNDVVLHLQVDDSAEPIKELRRLVEMSPPARSGRGRGGN